MDGLGYFALIVLVVLILLVIALWIALAIFPGRIARQRGHPQADAINICGWMGALTLGILAPLAFIWAYTKPVMKPIEVELPPESDENEESEGEEGES